MNAINPITPQEIEKLTNNQLREALTDINLKVSQFRYGMIREVSLVNKIMNLQRDIESALRSNLFNQEVSSHGSVIYRSTTHMDTSQNYFDMYLKRNGFITLPYAHSNFASFVNMKDRELITFDNGTITLLRSRSTSMLNEEIRAVVSGE